MPSEMADRFSFLLFILSISLIITLCVHFERENLAGPQPLPFYEVCEITGEVTADSKGIKGGREFFPFRILKYKGVDITEILQASSFTVITEGKNQFYKGQVLFLEKKIFFKNESKIIFVKNSNIIPLRWNNPFLKLRAVCLTTLNLKIGLLGKIPETLFTAFFLGKKNNPENPIFKDFRKSGSSHILALSGMHLAILAGFIIILFSPFFNKKYTFLLSFPLLILYFFIAGGTSSLQRAFIFLSFIGAGFFISVKPDLVHLLSLTFCIHCLLSPLGVQTVSFKLSYLALTGILLFSRRIKSAFSGVIPDLIRSVLAASISAQIGTLPVVVYYFNTVYTGGLFSALFLIPLVTVFLFLGVLFIILPAGFSMGLLPFLLDCTGRVISYSVRIFSHFPSFTIKSEHTTVVSVLEIIMLTLVFLVEYANRIKRIDGSRV